MTSTHTTHRMVALPNGRRHLVETSARVVGGRKRYTSLSLTDDEAEMLALVAAERRVSQSRLVRDLVVHAYGQVMAERSGKSQP